MKNIRNGTDTPDSVATEPKFNSKTKLSSKSLSAIQPRTMAPAKPDEKRNVIVTNPNAVHLVTDKSALDYDEHLGKVKEKNGRFSPTVKSYEK